jgi:hypothetical protein
MKQKRWTTFWDGGIGELSHKCGQFSSSKIDKFYSQIFPSFAPAKLAAIQNSVLANIRAKRAAMKVAQIG